MVFNGSTFLEVSTTEKNAYEVSRSERSREQHCGLRVSSTMFKNIRMQTHEKLEVVTCVRAVGLLCLFKAFIYFFLNTGLFSFSQMSM